MGGPTRFHKNIGALKGAKLGMATGAHTNKGQRNIQNGFGANRRESPPLGPKPAKETPFSKGGVSQGGVTKG